MLKSLFAWGFLATALLSSNVYSQILRPAPADLSALNVITGFHSQIHKTSGLEFKIFEIDGSGSVAMNPVYLYLGITNNKFGTDEESTILELPQVSKILKVRFPEDRSTIEIDARFDRPSLDGSAIQSALGTIIISIPMEKDTFPKKVQAKIKYHDKEK